MTRTDEELIEQYKQGDERAFNEIFERYYPNALKFFAADKLTANYAEDYCQEVFIRLSRAMLVSEIISFKSLFYKAIINRKRDLIRQKYRDKYKTISIFQEVTPCQQSASSQRSLLEIIEIESILDPDDDYQYEELRKIVRECINKIKSEKRRLIVSLKLEGLKEQQIAETLALNPHTVSSNWGRAKSFLRQCILKNLSA
jgi:RNA polymerase sigma-70 factor (ECF subfamily)